MFSNKPNYTKLRTNLRLCINRLKLLEKKKTELALKARREIADYIAAGKEDRARIRVEHIVREDYLVEAMEIVEMLCDMLLARFGMIERMAELDPGIEEAVATLLWVTPRLSSDVQELQEVSRQLTVKYGKEFAQMCQRNDFQKANEKVMHKISLAAPPKLLIESYMIEIAKSFKIPFEPDPIVMMGEPAAVSSLIDLGGEEVWSPGGMAGGDGPAFPPSASNSSSTGTMNSSAAFNAPYNQSNSSNPGNFSQNAFGPGTFDPPGGLGPGSVKPAPTYPGPPGNSASGLNPSSPPHADNLSHAELKHLEASKSGYPHRPPSPPGGGGQIHAGGLSPPYPTGGQFGSPGGVSSTVEKSPIPLVDGLGGGANQTPPQAMAPNHHGMHYHPFDAQMSYPEEQMPVLPRYDEVMNSPTQYPGTRNSTLCQPSFPTPTEYLQPTEPPAQPIPAPRSRSLTPLLPDVPTDLSPDLPSRPTGGEGFHPAAGGGEDVNFDDLARRFEELKKRK